MDEGTFGRLILVLVALFYRLNEPKKKLKSTERTITIKEKIMDDI